MNYQLKLDEILINTSKQEKISRLFLHSCCAPCSSYVLEYLSDYFEITIFYYNPNITDAFEYNKRIVEQQKLISLLKTKYPIDYISGEYNPKLFLELTKGLEKEKEGGIRCDICYQMRLEETAKIASSLGFDYFTTTLSISPYKNSQKLNEIGEKISKKYNIKYLYADFKKRNGYKRSIELSKEYGLYRQDYCGCQYSKLEMMEREKKKNFKEEKC